jgi:hypothetical protein
MTDLLFGIERNRKEAAKFSELAKTASSPFLRSYYSRIAERYLLEGEWRLLGEPRNFISRQSGPSTTERL